MHDEETCLYSKMLRICIFAILSLIVSVPESGLRREGTAGDCPIGIGELGAVTS